MALRTSPVGRMGLDPTVRSFGVLEKTQRSRPSLLNLAPSEALQGWEERILRISLRARTPKLCSVGASPNRTGLAGAGPENLALANNDNGKKVAKQNGTAIPVF